MGGFPKHRSPFFWSPNKKDHSILGSMLGPLIIGNYHMVAPSVLQV